MNANQAAALRKPFPPEAIGKLPKPTKKENQKGRCNECGGWHGLPAIHLDYVGHAAVTDRLLQVDPEWTWEPMGTTAAGSPWVGDGFPGEGLWIRLTVAGVTRPGFGAIDKEGPDGIKGAISDAIRNAAMRFGVALDLWSKEDLDNTSEPEAPAKAPRVGRAEGPSSSHSEQLAEGSTSEPVGPASSGSGEDPKHQHVWKPSPNIRGQFFCTGCNELRTRAELQEAANA